LSIKIQDGGLENGDRQCGQFSLGANNTFTVPKIHRLLVWIVVWHQYWDGVCI